jgi:hypothetical protein
MNCECTALVMCHYCLEMEDDDYKKMIQEEEE